MTRKRPRLFVTGSTSMLGRAVQRQLNHEKYEFIPSLSNLLNSESIYDELKWYKPDVILHLAGYNGGIEFNKNVPADIYYKTVMMGLNILHRAAELKLQKVVSILASCSYPDQNQLEMIEETLDEGLPNNSVECHGYAKRQLHFFSRQIYKQHNLCYTSLVSNNLFGPYDRFDPQRGKVVSAMIRRFVEAKEINKPFVDCWGSGRPMREFLYVDDAAKLILLAMEKYDNPFLPLNIGSPEEISIKCLAETIAKALNYDGEIRWLIDKNDGQLRKKLNIERMNSILLNKELFNYTNFGHAIQQTVTWYIENKNHWNK